MTLQLGGYAERGLIGGDPRTEAAQSPIYIAEIDFNSDTLVPGDSTKSVVLFGFDPRNPGDPPILAPFPLRSTTVSAEQLLGMNQWLTATVAPEYARRFGVNEEELRFPSLFDIGPTLSPYLRHEIGYSFLLLSESPDENVHTSSPFREALRNTGNIFLLSVGVGWHVNSGERQGLEEVYQQYFEQLFGTTPKDPHPDIAATNIQLQALKHALEVDMTQDWPHIAGLGHGLEFMIHLVYKRGGKFNIVGVGNGIPENYGTPIGVSYLSIEVT